MRLSGRWLFYVLLPAARFLLSRTNRAYVIVESGGKVLMVKGWFGRQLWQLPGGGVHRSETPAMAAVREAFEETKIKIQPEKLRLITSGRWLTDRLGYPYKIFLLGLSAQSSITKSLELIDAQWLEPSHLSSANCSREILQALGQANLL